MRNGRTIKVNYNFYLSYGKLIRRLLTLKHAFIPSKPNELNDMNSTNVNEIMNMNTPSLMNMDDSME